MTTVEQRQYDEPGGRLAMYDQALAEPFETLKEAELRRDVSPPIDFLPDRGNIHALVPPASNKERVSVLANTGAFGFNSSAFFDPSRDKLMASEIEREKAGFMPLMLAFSQPQDTFVYESPNPKKSEIILNRIANLYSRLGIEVSNTYVPVGSLTEWIKGARDRVVIPYALDPLTMEAYGDSTDKARTYYEQGLLHAAAYTKTGITQYWDSIGIPVPASIYLGPGEGRKGANRQIAQHFKGFKEVVVNTSGGAGGVGVYFAEVGSAELEKLLGELPPTETIQLQGRLPLEMTPCIIANIGDSCVEPLQVSAQRFSAPGVHTGNVWQEMDKQANKDAFPSDFWDVNKAALIALQKAGVRGQVNIDSLVISEDTARAYKLNNTTLMREANIRPATSSVLLRLRQGSINGEPVKRIHTSARLRIPVEEFLSGSFDQLLESVSGNGIQATVTNYDMHDGQTSFAFLATDPYAADQLSLAEEVVKSALSK